MIISEMDMKKLNNWVDGYRISLVDLNHQSQYFSGMLMTRALHVVNDSGRDLNGLLKVLIYHKESIIHAAEIPVSVKPFNLESVAFEYTIPESIKGCVLLNAVFYEENRSLACLSRQFMMTEKKLRNAQFTNKLYVYGEGDVSATFKENGIAFKQILVLTTDALVDCKLLIMERNTICPGTAQNKVINKFLRKGGHVLLLEQKFTIFPKMSLLEKHSQKVDVTCPEHPVIHLGNSACFEWWKVGPEIASHVYDVSNTDVLPLLSVEPDLSPLLQVDIGKGILIACQFKLGKMITDIPGAESLLLQILGYLDGYSEEKVSTLTETDQTESVLSGDKVPEVVPRELNGPSFVYVLNEKRDEVEQQNILKQMKPNAGYLSIRQLAEVSPWKRCNVSDGMFFADEFDTQALVFFYFVLNSKKKVNTVETELSLKCMGQGSVQFYLNGRSFKKESLAADNIVAYDELNIEKGDNHILIKWSPDNSCSMLSTQWCDFIRKTDNGFSFQ